MRHVTIADRRVGPGEPTYVIAEVSANHNGSLALARETVAAAAAAGADAVKFQTYRPDTITFDSDAEWFQVREGTLWDGRTLHSLYSEGQMPWEWHEELFGYAAELGLHAFSSPFDPSAVELLASLDVPAYKVASFEIVDIPLIALIAAQGKPVLISTGIATEADIRLALETCRAQGNDQVAVLKCTSSYPAPAAELNLRTIGDLAGRFECVAGYSDHTTTPTAAIVAVAQGASIIERHLILDRSLGGLDSAFSTDAGEFATLVAALRETEVALGTVTYEPTPSAVRSRRHARSLFVVADVRAGDLVSDANVRSIRPADGLPPVLWPMVRGRRFRTGVSAGTPLSEDLLAQD